jgi:hypothetical protein
VTMIEQRPQPAPDDVPTPEALQTAASEPDQTFARRVGSLVTRIVKAVVKPEEPPIYDGGGRRLPKGIEEWGNDRRVFLTPASRTSEIAKAHVIHTDEQEARFNAFFDRHFEERRRRRKELIARDIAEAEAGWAPDEF